MRFRRVLLVTPYARRRFFGGVRPPVGIAYIEEHLDAHGVATDGLDMNVSGGFAGLVRRVEVFRPDLVGFTVYTYQYLHTYGLIRRLKARFPTLSLVVGGPHVSALGAAVLHECDAIDYAIGGEGEVPLLELCRGTPRAQVPALAYRHGGEVVESTLPRVFERDLDRFAWPRFRSYPLDRYTSELEINTSRGCPYRCNFCAVSTIAGKKIRYRSVDSVLDELSYWYARGVRNFQFGDDNFLANKRRLSPSSTAWTRAG